MFLQYLPVPRRLNNLTFMLAYIIVYAICNCILGCRDQRLGFEFDDFSMEFPIYLYITQHETTVTNTSSQYSDASEVSDEVFISNIESYSMDSTGITELFEYTIRPYLMHEIIPVALNVSLLNVNYANPFRAKTVISTTFASQTIIKSNIFELEIIMQFAISGALYKEEFSNELIYNAAFNFVKTKVSNNRCRLKIWKHRVTTGLTYSSTSSDSYPRISKISRNNNATLRQYSNATYWKVTSERHQHINEHQQNLDLCFMLLGDWGKGGLSGDLTNITTSTVSSTRVRHLREGQNDRHENEGHEGHEGREGRDHANHGKNSYTYQNAISKSMFHIANGHYGGFNATHVPYFNSSIVSTINEDFLKPQYIAALGDNFYNDGIQSITDTQWNSTWESVYLKNPYFDAFYSNLTDSIPIMQTLPWYPVFGNHDYGYGESGLAAQIAYSEEHALWKFPSQYYTKTYPIYATNTSMANSSSMGQYIVGYVKTVYIDTTTLAPSENRCCNSESGINETTQLSRIYTQLRYIESELIRATNATEDPTWLLVVGHYPIFSTGEKADNSELVTYLEPLLRKYQVHAYICGHDHISEHLSHRGVHYFIAGAGSMTDKTGQTSSSAYKVHWEDGQYSSFATATASTSDFTIIYFNIAGEAVYNYTLSNPFNTNRYGSINKQLLHRYGNNVE